MDDVPLGSCGHVYGWYTLPAPIFSSPYRPIVNI